MRQFQTPTRPLCNAIHFKFVFSWSEHKNKNVILTLLAGSAFTVISITLSSAYSSSRLHYRWIILPSSTIFFTHIVILLLLPIIASFHRYTQHLLKVTILIIYTALSSLSFTGLLCRRHFKNSMNLLTTAEPPISDKHKRGRTKDVNRYRNKYST